MKKTEEMKSYPSRKF
jgi:hypothetical protein